MYGWVTPDDVLRHALAAFYARVWDAHRAFNPAESYVDWRQEFADDLVEEIGVRLATQMHQVGLPDPGEHHRDSARMLQRRQLGRTVSRAPLAEHVLQQSSVAALTDPRLSPRAPSPINSNLPRVLQNGINSSSIEGNSYEKTFEKEIYIVCLIEDHVSLQFRAATAAD